MLLVGLLVKLPVTRLTNSNLTLRQKLMTIDLVGFVVFVSGCIMLLLGLQWGGETYPWTSATIIGLLCGGAVAFLCLIFWFRYKGNGALIPPRLANNRINFAIVVTAFVQGGGVYTASFWLPIWFQGVKGASPLSSGIMILPMIISQFIASIVCGGLVQKTGYYLPEVMAGNAMVAIGAGLMSTFHPDTTEGQWIGYQILIGAGRGFAIQLVSLSNINEDCFLFTALRRRRRGTEKNHRMLTPCSLSQQCRPISPQKTRPWARASSRSRSILAVLFLQPLPRPSSRLPLGRRFRNTLQISTRRS